MAGVAQSVPGGNRLLAIHCRLPGVGEATTYRDASGPSPGEKLFVDFAGRTVEIRDRSGGPSIYAQIFVAVLGYSNLTYLQAVASQKTPDWVRCHVDCFAAMGGVPAWVVPDNLKAAVWRREKDRVVINPAYRECLQHYNTAALPARVRKAKDKAKAEVGVQIAQRWVLFALRDRTFFSLDELNDALRRLVVTLNAHPFKKMSGSRIERFEKTERSTLKRLPPIPFELCDWRYGVRAGDDYHVEHARASTPCRRSCADSVSICVTPDRCSRSCIAASALPCTHWHNAKAQSRRCLSIVR